MMTIPMSSSFMQVSGHRFHILAKFCWNGFDNLSHSCKKNSSFKLLSAKSLEGGYSRRWIRRPLSTKTEGRSKTTQSNKLTDSGEEIVDRTVSRNATINVNRPQLSDLSRIQLCDIRQRITENPDLANLVTTIAFDIETTGLSREDERIIEIALQDLAGGENSTFQALVNPERYVPNHHIHGITTYMVSRPDVPRMAELIPILLHYVKSRQKPGGYVMWVAHNGRSFDVPFLIKEFSRCSYEVPPNWLFLDTLPLAREVMKSAGISSGTSLQALREYYKIPLCGSAHRAMSDVHTLARVLHNLSNDLKLPLCELVKRSFTASDLINLKKKKNTS